MLLIQLNFYVEKYALFLVTKLGLPTCFLHGAKKYALIFQSCGAKIKMLNCTFPLKICFA